MEVTKITEFTIGLLISLLLTQVTLITLMVLFIKVIGKPKTREVKTKKSTKEKVNQQNPNYQQNPYYPPNGQPGMGFGFSGQPGPLHQFGNRENDIFKE